MGRDKWYHRIAVIFFLAAAVIHGAGYFTNYLYVIGWLMWLPAVILAVAAVVRIVRDRYIVNRYVNRKSIYLSTEFIVLAVSAAYVIFNVCWCCYLLRNGGGEFREGVYYLINLGERVKEITKEEYGMLLLAEYRLFTGHILLLYSLVVLFFRIKIMEEQ